MYVATCTNTLYTKYNVHEISTATVIVQKKSSSLFTYHYSNCCLILKEHAPSRESL